MGGHRRLAPVCLPLLWPLLIAFFNKRADLWPGAGQQGFIVVIAFISTLCMWCWFSTSDGYANFPLKINPFKDTKYRSTERKMLHTEESKCLHKSLKVLRGTWRRADISQVARSGWRVEALTKLRHPFQTFPDLKLLSLGGWSCFPLSPLLDRNCRKDGMT